MSCFPCINGHRKHWGDINIEDRISDSPGSVHSFNSPGGRRRRQLLDRKQISFQARRSSDDIHKGYAAKSFTFRELSVLTKNFKASGLIGEGGFGKVYKAYLETGQAIAVKQLDENSLQGNQEFIVEVLMLSLLHHPHLVNLIGYCSEGTQRLLVYEYMPMGSLEDHLFDPEKVPLDWNTRVKIAVGAAKGIEYLHCKTNPPVIYRDLKCANILLDNDFNPKLSDFGLAKLGPVGEKTHVSTRVMGTYGYCAPEYAMSGKLTVKSDIYSFGVVLLELITGRKVVDFSKKPGEQKLVAWARPYFKDRRKFTQMVDPSLQGRFSVRFMHHAIAITGMCLQEQPSFRPLIGDVVVALEYLASNPYQPEARSRTPPLSSPTQWDEGFPQGGKSRVPIISENVVRLVRMKRKYTTVMRASIYHMLHKMTKFLRRKL